MRIREATPEQDYMVRATRPHAPDAVPFAAELTADQEVPAPEGVPEDAGGTGEFSFDSESGELSFHIEFASLSGPEVGAHIHRAPAGEPGPVVIPLELGSPKMGSAVLDEELTAALMAGELYVNVHTEQNPSGEIRGQILAVAPAAEMQAFASRPSPRSAPASSPPRRCGRSPCATVPSSAVVAATNRRRPNRESSGSRASAARFFCASGITRAKA